MHPKILAAFDLKGPVAAFEVILDAIPESRSKGKARAVFTPSPFQAIERDFAFLVEQKVAADEVLRAAKGADRNLIEPLTQPSFADLARSGSSGVRHMFPESIRRLGKSIANAPIESAYPKIVDENLREYALQE